MGHGPGARGCWLLAIALPLLALATELLPVTFGTGEKATWDWGSLYVTMKFIALPLGGTVAGVVSIVLARRARRRLSAATVLLLIAVAYDVQLAVYPYPWFPGPTDGRPEHSETRTVNQT